MPRFDQDSELFNIPGSSFQFSAVKPTVLEATEYTLATIIIDLSSSLDGFGDNLLEMEKVIVRSCLKNPRAENLMVRVLHFNEHLDEIHGFRVLTSINPDDYQSIRTHGSTALYDAVFSGIGATLTYAKTLRDQDFEVNGVVYIVTDGEDNRSSATPKMIAELMQKAKKQEDIESLISILIGMDTGSAGVKDYLDEFKDKGGLTQFEWMGACTEKHLAHLAGYISKSISSASQSLGTGGPSQPINLTI